MGFDMGDLENVQLVQSGKQVFIDLDGVRVRVPRQVLTLPDEAKAVYLKEAAWKLRKKLSRTPRSTMSFGSAEN